MLYPQASLDLRHPCVQASGAIKLTYGQTRGKICHLGFLNGWQGRTSLHPLALAQSCIAKHQPPDLRLRQWIDLPHQSIDSLGFAFLFVEQYMKIEVLTSARVVDDDLILKFDSHIVGPRREKFKHIREHAADGCPHIHNTYDSSPLASLLRWKLEKVDGDSWAKVDQYCWCQTEYLVEIQNEGPDETSLHICAWRNLGSLKSHLDEKWQRQLSYGFHTVDYRSFHDFPGSVRDVFEAEEIP